MRTLSAPLPVRKKDDRLPADFVSPTIEDILQDACDVFGTTPDTLRTTASRKEEFILCRRIYCYVANVLTMESSSTIAALINRDRGTYLTHVEVAANMFETDDDKFMNQWAHYGAKSKIWFKSYYLMKKALEKVQPHAQ